MGIFALLLISTGNFTHSPFDSYINYGQDANAVDASAQSVQTAQPVQMMELPTPQLDKELYDQLMLALANNPIPKISTTTVATSTVASTSSLVIAPNYLWPVKTAPYPDFGSILPFHRIVAYYGNFLSTKMGVLGQYPPEQMLSMLEQEVAKWQAADPSTPVVPALDYIAVTAQGYPGPDGKYRYRMPDSEIDKAIELADQVNGIVILDVQVGLSTVRDEVPLLEKYLKLPNVELALDPEFAMSPGQVPGKYIGTLSATDINYAAYYLAEIVNLYKLPPKVLIVHRFTENMVTDYQNIDPLPEVQVVMDMDGYGTPAQKKKVYADVVYSEPVQFSGIKLFYKNDITYGGRMMTPEEVLSMRPIPSFIQFQ